MTTTWCMQLFCTLLVLSLLSHGATRNVNDNRGLEPIHYAVAGGAGGAVKLLWTPTTTKGRLLRATDLRPYSIAYDPIGRL